MKDAKNIEENMAKAAESMEKFFKKNVEPKTVEKLKEDKEMDELLKTIEALGQEGLKKAIPTLNETQLDLLNKALEKAIDLKQKAWKDDNKKPQKAQEPLTSERSNSSEGVDEWDEEMMDARNASQNHQGGTGKDGAWEGQVIKGKEPGDQPMAKDDEPYKKDDKNAKGGSNAENYQNSDGNSAGGSNADSYQNKYKAKEPLSGDAKDGSKSSGDLSKSEEEKDTMEKSYLMKQMVDRMKERGMHRDKCLEAMKKKGYDHEIAAKAWDNKDEAEEAGRMVDTDKKKKAKGQKKKPMAKSETVEKAGAVSAAEAELNAEANSKIEHSEEEKALRAKMQANTQEMDNEGNLIAKAEEKTEEVVEKAVKWGPGNTERLLTASTRRGQNCHYSVADSIIKDQEKREDFKKSGATYYGEKSEEKIEKSEKKELDVQDMIEKGVDLDESRYNAAVANQSPQQRGSYTHKTFDEAQIARDMGISEEAAAKILGVDVKKKS